MSLRPGREPLSPLAVPFPSRVPEMAPPQMLPAELPPPPALCPPRGAPASTRPCVQPPGWAAHHGQGCGAGAGSWRCQWSSAGAGRRGQDIHHGPHLLGQGAGCLHLGSPLGPRELHPVQVGDDVLQELWGDGAARLPAVPVDPGPCGTGQRDRWVLEQPWECG